MIFCPTNLITADNVTVNGEVIAFPAEDMLSNRLSEETYFETFIDIDFGSPQSIDTVNLIADASCTINANSSASWGAPPFTQVLTEEVTFIDKTYRYWRLTTSTSAHVGHFFLGNKLVIPNPIYGSIPNESDTDVINVSASKQKFTTNGVQASEQEFSFLNKSRVEYDLIKAFSKSSVRNKSGMFAQTEDDLTLFPPFFASMKFSFPNRRTKEAYNFEVIVTESK